MAATLAAHPNRHSTSLGCPAVPIPTSFDSLPTLSRQQIATRITQGELLVIHYPLVYKIPIGWLNKHPGGDLAILHFVGRDAGLEIEAYHTGMTVLKRMGVYTVGKIEGDGMGGKGNWRDLVPPVQMGLWPVPIPSITVTEHIGVNSPRKKLEKEKVAVEMETRKLTVEMMDPELPSEGLPVNFEYQAHIKESFRKLHLKFHELDLLKPPPFLSGYGPSLIIYLSLFAVFVHFYIQAQYLASAVFLGAFWHQITFIAHDAGHTAISGKWWTDRVIGILIGDAMGGISVGWWCDNHNVHHCK